MKSLVPLILFSLFFGCANYQPKPLSRSDTASAFEARTLNSLDLEDFIEKNTHEQLKPWPPALWDFRKLECVAVYYSPALDVMRARWGVAEAAVITAGGIPNPAISLLGQHHTSTPGGISPWTWGISLDIPIETAGKRGYRIRRAENLSEAARLDISTTAWQVRSGLRNSLLELYAATERERILLDRLAIAEKITRIFEERLASGESSGFEVTRSRLALDKTRLLLADNQKKKAVARVALAEALGLPAKAIDGIRISFALFEERPCPIELDDIRKKALLGRPDILAALSEYEASQSALQLEIARQYPDFHIGPGYEWDQGDNKWSIGFSIELPVLNRNQGPVAEAEARRKEFAAKFMALQAGIIGLIDRARVSYSESLKNLLNADNLVSTENAKMRAVQDRFEAGEADLLELEQARLQFNAAVISRCDLLVSAHADLGKLEDAIRQPLVSTELSPAASETRPRTEGN